MGFSSGSLLMGLAISIFEVASGAKGRDPLKAGAGMTWAEWNGTRLSPNPSCEFYDSPTDE